MGKWEVVGTTEFEQWFLSLEDKPTMEVSAAIDELEARGPTLSRPTADKIKNSDFHNMKELRPKGAAKHCRILFIFDPQRKAVLLLGGDKTGKWQEWYDEAIPQADEIYRNYLKELEKGNKK